MKRRHASIWTAWVSLAGAAAVCAAAAGCDGMDLRTGRTPTGGTPSLPEDREAYTILLCPSYLGLNHARESAEAKRKTSQATGWRGVYVVHEERSSSLYHGRYASQAEASDDLQRVREWKTSQGALPFQYALVTKRAGQRVGPPEWDLAIAPIDPRGYTVVVGVFFNDPEENITTRKELAVEDCRYLREHGVEAYYSHGPEQSFVTIGVFPESAYRMEETAGGGVKAVLESEAMRKVLASNPHLAVNRIEEKVNVRDPRTGKTQWMFTASYVTAVSAFRGGSTAPPPPRRQPQPRQGP